VTSDFGGSEEQLNSNSAAIASAADLLRAMTAGIRRERVMVCSGSFWWSSDKKILLFQAVKSMD